jgi:hypothetical protein
LREPKVARARVLLFAALFFIGLRFFFVITNYGFQWAVCERKAFLASDRQGDWAQRHFSPLSCCPIRSTPFLIVGRKDEIMPQPRTSMHGRMGLSFGRRFRQTGH